MIRAQVCSSSFTWRASSPARERAACSDMRRSQTATVASITLEDGTEPQAAACGPCDHCLAFAVVTRHTKGAHEVPSPHPVEQPSIGVGGVEFPAPGLLATAPIDPAYLSKSFLSESCPHCSPLSKQISNVLVRCILAPPRSGHQVELL